MIIRNGKALINKRIGEKRKQEEKRGIYVIPACDNEPGCFM